MPRESIHLSLNCYKTIPNRVLKGISLSQIWRLNCNLKVSQLLLVRAPFPLGRWLSVLCVFIQYKERKPWSLLLISKGTDTTMGATPL